MFKEELAERTAIEREFEKAAKRWERRNGGVAGRCGAPGSRSRLETVGGSSGSDCSPEKFPEQFLRSRYQCDK